MGEEAVLFILLYLLSLLFCVPCLCLSNNWSFLYLCRRNSSLDPPFHFWRISVHCLGKCCAWSPGGKESLVSAPCCSSAAIHAARWQGYNPSLCLFLEARECQLSKSYGQGCNQNRLLAIYCICGTKKTLCKWELSPGWAPEIVLAQHAAGPARANSWETCPVRTPLPRLFSASSTYWCRDCLNQGPTEAYISDNHMWICLPCFSLWPYPLIHTSAASFWQQFAEFDSTVKWCFLLFGFYTLVYWFFY